MKKILLLTFFLAAGLIVSAEKLQTSFSAFKWYCVKEKMTSIDELRSYINNHDTVDIRSTIISSANASTFYSVIEIPDTAETKMFLEMGNNYPFTKVMVDGLPMLNIRNNGSFISEIPVDGQKEEFLLTLITDTISTTSPINLSDYLKGMYISCVSKVCIAWCEPIKDPFFGGYMIEVHVWNRLQKDIDGKLKAQLSNAQTLQLVAENNNCAFTRSKSEAIIDINFPDAKDQLIKGKYFVDIVLVDKEKNEEVIDQLHVPIWLN